MRKMKFATAFVSAVIMFCVGNNTNVAAKEYCGSLKYITTDGKAIITGFSGNPEILEIPEKIDGKEVVCVRENAFYKCRSLEKIVLPDTVSFVGHHAFYECTSLKEVYFSDNVYSLDEGCFSGCISLEKVDFPDNLKQIEEYVFFNCRSLKEVKLPVGVEEIGNYAFANCSELSEAELGTKLLKIGDFCFYNCGKLDEINIPLSVSAIGSCALGYTENLFDFENDFKIKGGDSSLGKIYAEGNGIEFESTNLKATQRKISHIPAVLAIASGIGLVCFWFLEKLKGFERKYEYEY